MRLICKGFILIDKFLVFLPSDVLLLALFLLLCTWPNHSDIPHMAPGCDCCDHDADNELIVRIVGTKACPCDQSSVLDLHVADQSRVYDRPATLSTQFHEFGTSLTA
jgi:hypothetical protein